MLDIEIESLALVISQVYIEYDLCGMEYLIGQFRVTYLSAPLYRCSLLHSAPPICDPSNLSLHSSAWCEL